jgi:hypothetical protein
MLTPPLNAEPATYPFTVAYGILGQPLTPVYLQLCVQAAPAVKLKAKANAASVWVPFARALDYQLTVESQGNADTSYRVSVKDPMAERDEQGRTKGPDDLYETPTWRYLFDRELDTLTSPSANRAPTPEQHRLKLTRKGIWWFGWIERHKMTVAARPVTDSTNGGKGENVVELAGRRWRLFPLPGFIMIPLLLLLLVMVGSGAQNLVVTNALLSGDEYYVFGSKLDDAPASAMDVHLKWDQPVYAVIGGSKSEGVNAGGSKAIDISRGKATLQEQVQKYGTSQTVTYRIGSKFTGSGEQVTVRFVPLRTSGALQIQNTAGGALPGLPSIEKVGLEGLELPTLDYTVVVPTDGLARINFANLSPEGSGVNVVLWTVTSPSSFKIDNFHTSGNSAAINSHKTFQVKVKYIGDQAEDEQVWELLTTDAKFRRIRIHLKVAGQ